MERKTGNRKNRDIPIPKIWKLEKITRAIKCFGIKNANTVSTKRKELVYQTVLALVIKKTGTMDKLRC